jgi:hypothetical protein
MHLYSSYFSKVVQFGSIAISQNHFGMSFKAQNHRVNIFIEK